MIPIAASLIMLAHTITGAYIGVDPDSVRPIKAAYTMSPQKFIDVARQRPPISVIYRQTNETVYLAVKGYYKDRYIFSQLLHETVHHYQYVLNIKNKCHNEEEAHAFALQGIYLLSKGADWINPVEEREKYNNGVCN